MLDFANHVALLSHLKLWLMVLGRSVAEKTITTKQRFSKAFQNRNQIPALCTQALSLKVETLILCAVIFFRIVIVWLKKLFTVSAYWSSSTDYGRSRSRQQRWTWRWRNRMFLHGTSSNLKLKNLSVRHKHKINFLPN